MPSQGRLRRGRTRSKTRALRAARSKPMISEAEGGIGEETPAVESPQRGKSPKKQAIMAATPQPSRKEFLGGLTRQTQKWSQNRFRMVLLTLFILMVLCYYMSPGECFSRAGRQVTGIATPGACPQRPPPPHRPPSLLLSLHNRGPHSASLRKQSGPDFSSLIIDLPHRPALLEKWRQNSRNVKLFYSGQCSLVYLNVA